MQEFAFFGDSEFPLTDNIAIMSNKKETEFIVSNSKELKAQIYAPEIDFFTKYSKLQALEKAKAISKIYEANAMIFDSSSSIDESKNIGNKILVLDADKIASKLTEHDYKVISLSKDEIRMVYGQIGDLTAIVATSDGEVEVDFDILLATNPKDFMLRQSGCYDIDGFSEDEILSLVSKITPKYNYKKVIEYDPDICDYCSRLGENCLACQKACPTVAILKDSAKKELIFSDIDCINCGKCIGVCPTGALKYRQISLDGVKDAAKEYEDNVMLIASNLDFMNLKLDLKDNVLPISFENIDFLENNYLLTIIQNLGADVIIYAKEISPVLKESANLLNGIFEKIYGKKVVYLASNLEELNNAQENALVNEAYKYENNHNFITKRDDFANKLKPFIDKDYGVIKTKHPVNYGKILINKDTCTLCAACVGACKSSALYADSSDNSIKYNASLCTLCGYCIQRCAEKGTIKIQKGELKLNPEYFSYKEMAKDELFACVECGKKFATKKSVEKIASILAPKFAFNPAKQRTLYCCPDCKARLAIENGDFNE